MDDGGDVLEKPLVRTLADMEDVGFLLGLAGEVGPAAGDYRADAEQADRLVDDGRDAVGVVDNDATEADVNGARTGIEEFAQLGGRNMIGGVAEDEATDV